MVLEKEYEFLLVKVMMLVKFISIKFGKYVCMLFQYYELWFICGEKSK